MSLIPFQDVNEATLLELCSQGCPESQTLDFKKTLPGLSDRERSEFLKDVCALANTDGGDLVYGIAEGDGHAKELNPVASEPADAAKRRLGQISDAGLEPRVVGLRFQDVPVTGGYALIVRVPASFNGPHRYIINGVAKFVMRNGTHTTELTYDQLRTAFDRTATLTERARRFRDDRIAAIANRKTWKPMMNGPVCAVHFIPIKAMAGNHSVDIFSLYNNYTPFMFPSWGGASRSTNLDGLVVHPGIASGQLEIGAYTQVFRSGAFETSRYGGGLADPSRKEITAIGVSVFIRDAIQKFLKAGVDLGSSGPAVASAALLTIGDYEFGLPAEHFGSRRRSDRENIVLPETWINAIESVTNVDEVARPLLEVLWQAFGVERCYLYDAQGHWQQPR